MYFTHIYACYKRICMQLNTFQYIKLEGRKYILLKVIFLSITALLLTWYEKKNLTVTFIPHIS
jgi:hypothetical protein